MKEEILNEELVCSGYGFLSNELDVLCLQGNILYSKKLKDALPTEILIHWLPDLKEILSNLLKDRTVEVKLQDLNVSVSYYEPCPFSLYREKLTGEYRLEI